MSEAKACIKCKEEKTLDEFRLHKRSKDGHQSTCKYCMKFSEIQWRVDNKEKCRLSRVKHRYGLNKEEFDSLPKFCQICRSTDDLCVDHDHKTGVVRSTLCGLCNSAIGMFQDRADLIRQAFRYLSKGGADA